MHELSGPGAVVRPRRLGRVRFGIRKYERLMQSRRDGRLGLMPAMYDAFGLTPGYTHAWGRDGPRSLYT